MQSVIVVDVIQNTLLRYDSGFVFFFFFFFLFRFLNRMASFKFVGLFRFHCGHNTTGYMPSKTRVWQRTMDPQNHRYETSNWYYVIRSFVYSILKTLLIQSLYTFLLMCHRFYRSFTTCSNTLTGSRVPYFKTNPMSRNQTSL